MSKELNEVLDRFLELCAGTENTRRRQLWADHNALKLNEQIPVYFSVPFDWSIIRMNLWTGVLKTNLDLKRIMAATGEYPTDLAEEVILFQLKQRIFYLEEMPGDMPVEPRITTNFNLLWMENRNSMNPLWDKVDFDMQTGDFHISPLLKVGDKLSRIKFASMLPDMELHKKRLAVFDELTGGRLTVQDDNLGYGYLNTIAPFSDAVRLSGVLELMMGFIDDPDWVHQLMELLTVQSIKRCHDLNKALGKPAFSPTIGQDDVNCQLFSPSVYDEFIYPYEKRCAEKGHDYYYHSCGSLTAIFEKIATLPNLHRLHVSPFSDLSAAVAAAKGRFVIQKLMDTQRDIRQADEVEMMQSIKAIKEAGLSAPLEVACHCETLEDFEKSRRFVEIARKLLRR